MKIVTPASQLFNNAHNAKALTQASDSLELRPELALTPAKGQVFSHCHISNPEFDINLEWSKATKTRLLQELEDSAHIPFLSFHLARDCLDVQIDERGRYTPRSEPMSKSDMLRHVEQNVTWVRKTFDSSILLENNNYYDTGAYEIVTSAEFVSEVIQDNQLGFLFDYAHAKVSAHNRGIPLGDYVDALPLESTEQIHISLPRMSDGEMVDAHGLPGLDDVNEVHQMLAKRSSRTPPITVEYYRSAGDLLDFLKMLRRSQEVLS